jgi:uncharacterized membrane protein YdjX (TVP38/TMEM64 family)
MAAGTIRALVFILVSLIGIRRIIPVLIFTRLINLMFGSVIGRGTESIRKVLG